MTELHDLQARAGHLEREIGETGDQHSSLLSDLETGMSAVRDHLIQAKSENDRLTRENAELKRIAEKLLGTCENKPVTSFGDKLAELDGQLHGLLKLTGNEAGGTEAGDVESQNSKSQNSKSESARSDIFGPIGEIRDRVRALTGQLLAPLAPEIGPKPARNAPKPAPAAMGAPPRPSPRHHERRGRGSPRSFDRPIRALAEKAQNVLPKVRLRFDAEADYALTILRRIKGNRLPFSIEEVRELINGKFGLSLTNRDDAQLSASMCNQNGVTRGARKGQSWRFEMG